MLGCGSVVWWHEYNKSLAERIEKIQNKAMRVILKPKEHHVHVVVNFLFQLIFIFTLF